MGKLGLFVARAFGRRLPAFGSQREAEVALFRRRDCALERMIELSELAGGAFVADFTPESLKCLERWFFSLSDSEAFSKFSTSRTEMEECMPLYVGEVAARNCPDAKWVVKEYVFESGKYEIGIERGLMTVMYGPMTDLHKRPGNKRRQSMYREYASQFAV